jgi:heptosyltransferase I
MSAAPALSDYRSLTVIKPSSLGDVVHALPAVAVLRAAMPQARLRWLVNTEWAPLIKDGGLVDEVVPFPRREFRGVAGFLRAVRWFWSWRKLPRGRPELVIDLQGLLRSGLAARLRGGARVIGLSDAREGASWLHHQSVAVAPGAHAVDRCLAVPRALGLPIPPEPEFSLPKGNRPAGWPDVKGGVIVLHPFSRGIGKSMPATTLHRLLEKLTPLPVVVVGSGEPLSMRAPHVTDLCGRTSLLELIWCLSEARVVVSVDSGPMHIAAAVNPAGTLGLHTWSDPRRVGPYPENSWVWKAGRIAHRQDFSPGECRADSPISDVSVPGIVDWVLDRMQRDSVNASG